MDNIKNRQLTDEETLAFGCELDALYSETMSKLGERESCYIKRTLILARYFEIFGRVCLMGSFFPLLWLFGVVLLAISKIVNNMELGHNVMHGQYNWMNDPVFHGNTFEWDTVATGDGWRHSHNYMHHTYTNIVGMDKDLGYRAIRVTAHQRWRLHYFLQIFLAFIIAIVFQYAVASHTTLGFECQKKYRYVRKSTLKLIAKKVGKDYVFFPLLAGPFFMSVLLGNMIANITRNLWACLIIFCGHFTTHIEFFSKETLENETKGRLYLRQVKASSNIEGGKLFHFLSGHLGYQIEHHLFPDMPAICYAGISGKVKDICARYGVSYNTGRFSHQLYQVLKRFLTHSFPNNLVARVQRSETRDLIDLK